MTNLNHKWMRCLLKPYSGISGSIDDVAGLFVNVSMLYYEDTMTFESGSCWDMLMLILVIFYTAGKRRATEDHIRIHLDITLLADTWQWKSSQAVLRYPKEMMGYYFYYPLENKIFVVQNAKFFENSLTFQEASGSHALLEASGSDVGLELIQEDDTQPSENTSERHDEYGFFVDAEEHELGDLNEPPNYKAALSDSESEKWLDAMNTEIQSMKDNQVWSFIDLPLDGQTIGNIRAIRIILAIVAFYDYEIWQMYVKITFLNGHLSEDQASRRWNKRLDAEIKKIGFTQNPNEPCVYLKSSKSNVAFLGPYMSMTYNRAITLQCCKMLSLGYKFNMENSKRGSVPMQEKLEFRKSQGVQTPSEVKHMQNVPYASAIGTIMYTVRCTRPNVAFAQNLYSRFQQNPGDIHWIAIKTILKYLRNTKDMTDKDDTKSQSGYVFVLNAGAVDWKSAKQSTTTISSTKVEYIATAEASIEAV
ncbi:hypothetical protein Tco_0482359 [Tanacetum coccineum]